MDLRQAGFGPPAGSRGGGGWVGDAATKPGGIRRVAWNMRTTRHPLPRGGWPCRCPSARERWRCQMFVLASVLTRSYVGHVSSENVVCSAHQGAARLLPGITPSYIESTIGRVSRPSRAVICRPANIEASVDITAIKSKSIAELHEMAEGLNISNYSGLRKQDLIFRIEQNLLDSEVVLRGEGVLEVLPEGYGFLRSPGLELPVRPRRHLRLPQPDQALRPAHRRHGAGAGAPAQGGRALPRAAQGGAGQRRRARQGQAPHRLRQPAPALPRQAGAAGDDAGRDQHAGDGPDRADRQGAARADRRAAARPARRSCCRRWPTPSPRTTPRCT